MLRSVIVALTGMDSTDKQSGLLVLHEHLLRAAIDLSCLWLCVFVLAGASISGSIYANHYGVWRMALRAVPGIVEFMGLAADFHTLSAGTVPPEG